MVGDLAVLLWWPDQIDDALLAAVAADPVVVAVEPNYRFRDPESVRRRYPIVDLSGDADGLATQPAAALVHAAEAHAASRGRGVVVAVVDSGVDPEHPALAGRLASGGLDLVDGDEAPWDTRNGVDDDGDGDLDEGAGHGSFVASLVAALAPEARILPYRVLDDDGGGSAYGLALALADATARGVDVVNLSLVYHRRSAAVDHLLELAAARGIVVVAAAGNDASAAVPFPASDSHVIAVTALAADGSGLADFATRGAATRVAAPGEEVRGALDGGRYATWSGTSMAAPFAAATAALIRSLDPAVTPAVVAAALAQAGRPISNGAWSGIALDMAAACAAVGASPPRALPSPGVAER